MVFLDRDDTLIKDTGYLNEESELQFLDETPEALRMLIQNGWLPVVLTNQSGVARGYLNEDRLRKIHRTLHQQLLERDAPIYAWFYCPHLPPDQLRDRERSAANEAYLIDCSCRKPSDGLWHQALEHLPPSFSFRTSWSIGDRTRDVRPGKKLGGNGILIPRTLDNDKNSPPDLTTAETLLEAAGIIIGRT